MSKAVLITGATGVIGLALAQRFAATGQRVIAPVRVHVNPSGLRKKRADALQTLISKAGDLLTLLAHQSLLKRNALIDVGQKLIGCKVIYHMGGWAGHKISEEELPEAFASNVLWTGALAKFAANEKIERFIFASTRAVYDFIPREEGVPPIVNEWTKIDLPIEVNDWKERALLAFNDYLGSFLREETHQSPEAYCRKYLAKHPLPNIDRSLWYPLTKLMGEQIVSSLSKHEVEGISLRLKPVLGPSPVEHESRTIPRTVSKLLQNGSETAWPEKTGYLYLEDLVDALEIMNPSSPNPLSPPPGTKIILLGQNRQSISQLELFRKIADILGPDFKIDYNPHAQLREDEICDTSFAENSLGLQNTPFELALETTVRFFALRQETS